MATVQEQPSILCPSCGQPNPAGNRFCGSCGESIAAVAPAPQNPLAAPPSNDGAVYANPTAAPAVGAVAPVPPPVASNAANAPVAPAHQPVPRPPAAAAPAAAPASRVLGPPPYVPPSQRAAAAAAPGATGDAVRERERERLLTLVNVQRARGDTAAARKTLEETLGLSEGMPGAAIAPIHELMGDLYANDSKITAALEWYKSAHELDKKRVSAERKFAAMTLRAAEARSGDRLAMAMMQGESIADLMASGAMDTHRGRRNAGIAMLLSAVIPGFGQFYNGHFVKGAVVLILYVAGMLYFSTHYEQFLAVVNLIFPATLMSHSRSLLGRHHYETLSATSAVVGVLTVVVWLYSLVDAPFMAAQTPKGPGAGPTIDKTGWEV